MRTAFVESVDAIYRVAMYTGIPKDSIPSEKIRPQYSEYYEWTGFSNLRLDEKGCLQPGKSIPGALIGNICCGCTLYLFSDDSGQGRSRSIH